MTLLVDKETTLIITSINKISFEDYNKALEGVDVWEFNEEGK